MGSVTISLAVVGCILVVFVRPVYGLAVYSILSMWYPYMVGTVKVGTLDFSVGRIVLIVLFLNVLLNTKLAAKFRVIWLDRLVVILFVAEAVAGLATTEMMKLLEYRSGDFFDMALPYFAVRLIITSKEQYISLLKAIIWSAGILVVFGFYECLTGHNLLKMGRFLIVPEVRMRIFHRAQATFRHPIYFGVFSGMTAAVCMGLAKNIKKNAFVYKILAGWVFLGAFSSMSSGGLLALVVGLVFIAFYQYRHYWKQALIGLILMCGVVEVVSNRHFYDVIDRFTFSSKTAWYRARLFEVAFFEGGMSGHWLFGYGLEDPRWCDKIDMRNHTDMVNHYLMKLCRYGLIGFIPFCAVIITAIKELFGGFWLIRDKSDQWLVWCVAGGLFGVLLAFNSVSLFGQPMTMLFMMFGFCAVLHSITTNPR